MTPVSRVTAAGRAYLDLKAKAKKESRLTDELIQLYVLEGFLARLAVSTYADQLVLKGGVLLAAFDTRRPTRDIDFAARDLTNDTEHILGVTRAILAASQKDDDGLVFDPAGVGQMLVQLGHRAAAVAPRTVVGSCELAVSSQRPWARVAPRVAGRSRSAAATPSPPVWPSGT